MTAFRLTRSFIGFVKFYDASAPSCERTAECFRIPFLSSHSVSFVPVVSPGCPVAVLSAPPRPHSFRPCGGASGDLSPALGRSSTVCLCSLHITERHQSRPYHNIETGRGFVPRRPRRAPPQTAAVNAESSIPFRPAEDSP